MPLIEYQKSFETKLLAEESARAYENGYPPQGYGTTTKVFQDKLTGRWVMKAERWHSCD
jgi:hypothetical protein